MNNQSMFVKIIIWLMVFLMSVGFAALVISPWAGSSFLGGGDGRDATEKLVTQARADVKSGKCADEKATYSAKELAACKDALQQLAAAYTTLAQPGEGDTELPRDYQQNLDRAGEAYARLYEIDKSDEDNTALYAGFLRDTNKTQQSLDLWTLLVKKYPKNDTYLLNQAGGYQALGDVDQTIATLRLYLRRFPDAGQVSTIKDEIKSLEKQKKEQAQGGGATPSITTG